MSNPLLLVLDNNLALGKALAQQQNLELGSLCWRHFPDGESYVRVDSPCAGRDVIVLCSLDQPDQKTVPLCFLADLLRDLGAKKIGLITPYLAYLRQDTQFQPGEAVSSRTFARIISTFFDWLITVDPHLHRYQSLDEIYPLTGVSLSASPVIAQWVRKNVTTPLIVGPDMESRQWVEQLALELNCPYLILEKERLGDHEVRLNLPDLNALHQHTPIIVDDICSSGTTLLEVAEQLQQRTLPPPLVIVVHGLFAGGAWEKLQHSSIRQLVSCNSVPHHSNAIDLSELIGEQLKKLL